MHNKTLNLLVLTGLICISTANASYIATVTALQSPVWLLRANTNIELRGNSELKIGDNIATGDTGRAEMRLWVDARLRLNSNSEITIRARDKTEITIPDRYPELYVHRGRACISYTAQSSSESKFIVNLGDTMFAAIHLRGDICVLRRDGLSAIKLRAGSVQVTHSVDPNTMVLSETGTEFHIDDNGSFELLLPGGGDTSTLEIERPFIIELPVAENAVDDSRDVVESDNAAIDEITIVEAETTTHDEVSAYIYTVYVFSTRSAGAAGRVNREFQKAGHDTQVFASESGSVTYYRVGVSGFATRPAAQNFSDSVVGILGVKDTWIGKDKPSVIEAAIETELSGEFRDTVDSNSVAIEEPTSTEPATVRPDTMPGTSYTVYLFSSRHEEVAEKVNLKFQQVGLETQVYASDTGPVKYFRVGISGFRSKQSAKNFSDSVVGALGVTGTWIGKESQ